MAQNSTISWTSLTWNPVRGCDKVSQGCKFCYAETMTKRFEKLWGKFEDVRPMPEKLAEPLRIKKPNKIFVNSMSDLFHEDVDVMYIAKVYAIMFLAHWHTFQVLTKRDDRMQRVLNSEFFIRMVFKYIHEYGEKSYLYDEVVNSFPFKNVWQGVSAEDQENYGSRVRNLLKTPAHVRFLSLEPLLGPIDLGFHKNKSLTIGTDDDAISGKIHWIIVGGESGTGNVRPMHPDWVRSIRDQCKASDVPFLFKQWGKYAPGVTGKNDWVVLNDGRKIEYTSNLVEWCKKNNISDRHWNTLKPNSMSKSNEKDFNILDGVQHLNFPV